MNANPHHSSIQQLWQLHAGTIGLHEVAPEIFEPYVVGFDAGHQAATQHWATLVERTRYAAQFALARRKWGERDIAELARAYGIPVEQLLVNESRMREQEGWAA